MSQPISDRTLGEVARRLDEVFTRFEQVASDLPRTFVNRDLFESKLELVRMEHSKAQVIITEMDKRVSQLEDDKTWLYRLVIGAVIMALLGLVIGFSHGLGGTSTKGLPHQGVVVSTR